MPDKILIPLDRSSLAECVLPHGVALARTMDAEIVLLHVLTVPQKLDPLQPVDPLEWRIRRAEAETYLDAVAARLRPLGLLVETDIVEGDAAEQIVAYARDHNIVWTVLSSHGLSGLSGWNVSSVVQKTILRIYTSVLIVRAYEPGEMDMGALHYERLLVPLDGSQRAECVLPVAAAFARAHEAQIVLAHVVHRPEMPRRTPPDREDAELAERVVERNRAEAARYLEDVRERLSAYNVDTRLLISDHLSGSLHELAQQESVSLVLLSAHGYSGDTRWPYGGVVISFVAYGSAPLLIVQDVPADQAIPTRAEIAAHNIGRR